MKTISREGIQRMIDGGKGGRGNGSGSVDPSALSGYATQGWVNENYLSIEFFSSLFKAYDSAATPNEILPNDGDTSAITNIKAMFGFWTEQYLSSLGKSPNGSDTVLNEPLSSINDAGLGEPTQANVGIIWNGSTWVYGSTGGGSTSWANITGKPTTISGYGITDAYIQNGTIQLGNNTITPLTSFIETDPTVPAWAKESTKPSYSFSEITGSIVFSQLPTLYWADVAVSNESNNNTSPQFGNLRLRPGSANYGSYLRFGDGNYCYLNEDSDDHLKIYGSKGVEITTGSSYNLTWNGQALLTNQTTFWGSSVNNGVVNGSITMQNGSGMGIWIKDTSGAAHKALCMDGGNSLYLGFDMVGYGSTFVQGQNLHFKIGSGTEVMEINSYGQVYISQGTQGLRIGDGLITWDANNNMLKITDKDGNAAGLYALGPLSSLGFSSGVGSAIIDNLTVNSSILVSDYAENSLKALSVTKATSATTVNYLNIGETWKALYHDTRIYGYNVQLVSGNGAYTMSMNGSGKVTCPNYLQATRVYLNNNCYLNVSGTSLYYNNGSSDIQIA